MIPVSMAASVTAAVGLIAFCVGVWIGLLARPDVSDPVDATCDDDAADVPGAYGRRR